MKYKELLCIGGPKDGQVVQIRDGVSFLEIPVLSGPECVALADLATPPEDGTLIDVLQYRREWVRDFDGTICEVLLLSGVYNPIQRLIAGYKPQHDSADKA